MKHIKKKRKFKRKKNRQQTFDAVVRHMLTQRRRALNDTGLCVLRNKEGAKCPMGFLISRYNRYFESYNAKGLVSHWPELFEEWTVDVELYQDLMDVHDYENPNKWRSYLFGLSKKHKLKWNFENPSGRRVRPPSSNWYEND